MTIQITSAAQLANAFWSPKDGEAYVLTGTFPAGRAKRDPLATAPVSITLDCTAATFTGQQYWTVMTGVAVVITGGAYAPGSGLRISGFGRLSVSGATFDGCGIMADHGGAVSITNNKFTNAGCGVSITASKGVVIADNSFTAMLGDCMDLPGCQDVTISRNHCDGGSPAPLAHPDFIQTWGVIGGLPMTGWVIEDNYAKGPTQGLFLPDGVIGIARRNHLETGFANAIAVGSGTALDLEDNTVLTLAGAKDQARIATYPGGSVNYIVGNSVNGLAVGMQHAPPPPPVDPRDAQIATLTQQLGATATQAAGLAKQIADAQATITADAVTQGVLQTALDAANAHVSKLQAAVADVLAAAQVAAGS